MKAMLTSSLGGSCKVNGKWEPCLLIQENGQLERLQAIWRPEARVVIISADPADDARNDSVLACLREALPMSGLSISSIESCDDRNPAALRKTANVDVLLLAGGHVPTQNRFMKRLGLREWLSGYQGLVVAMSAGSMNCADVVYAGPELDGEATDPLFQRWITGLGITEVNIFPHYQSLKDDWLDGMRLIEDITFADSMGHDIIAINDGSYIMIEDGMTTLYGEAYLIRDGKMRQICREGQSLVLPLK